MPVEHGEKVTTVRWKSVWKTGIPGLGVEVLAETIYGNLISCSVLYEFGKAYIDHDGAFRKRMWEKYIARWCPILEMKAILEDAVTYRIRTVATGEIHTVGGPNNDGIFYSLEGARRHIHNTVALLNAGIFGKENRKIFPSDYQILEGEE